MFKENDKIKLNLNTGLDELNRTISADFAIWAEADKIYTFNSYCISSILEDDKGIQTHMLFKNSNKEEKYLIVKEFLKHPFLSKYFERII